MQFNLCIFIRLCRLITSIYGCFWVQYKKRSQNLQKIKKEIEQLRFLDGLWSYLPAKRNILNFFSSRFTQNSKQIKPFSGQFTPEMINLPPSHPPKIDSLSYSSWHHICRILLIYHTNYKLCTIQNIFQLLSHYHTNVTYILKRDVCLEILQRTRTK